MDDPATRYIAIAGRSLHVDVRLTGPRPRALCLAPIGRGLTFGELAGVDGALRPARPAT